MQYLTVPLLTTLLLQGSYLAQAQLQSCADIGVAIDPIGCNCHVQNSILDSTGTVNITTELSTEPLAWLVAGTIGETYEQNVSPPDQRVFFLQQPPSINLRSNTSVEACALFFTGVGSSLKFNSTENQDQSAISKGSCQDALTAQCVSDWTSQAYRLVDQIDDSLFTCQLLADKMQANPPQSCTVVTKTWGDVTARSKFCQTCFAHLLMIRN